MTPAVPPDDEESGRLRVLRELRLLDSSREECFDAAVRLLARMARVPIATLSLVDAGRVWFKAIHGAELDELSRDQTCCTWTIAGDVPFLVDDLTADPRFAGVRTVTGAPYVRAYAGLPLTVEDQRIGALAVLDVQPRHFGEAELAALHDVGRLVCELLKARLKEQRWRLQEARVRTASRAGSDWLWETDAQGRFTWASASMETHTGLRIEDKLGKLPHEILLRRDDPEHARSYDRYLAAREQREPFFNLIADMRTPGGLVTVAVNGVPVFDSAGRFRGYRGATRVVTAEIEAQRQAREAQALREAQLRESEARTAAVLQSLPDLWFVLDAEGRYVQCGTAAQHLLHMPFEQMRGASLEEVLPPAVAVQHKNALQRALATGTLQRVEYELQPMGDPTTRTFEGRFMPMSGTQVLLIVRDLTELRTMERELQIMHRAIEGEASLPITVVDVLAPDHPVVYVNPAFERLTGYGRDEVLGRNCRFLQGPETDQPALGQVREALRHGRSTTVVLHNYRKDGSRFINELHIAPVHDSHGRVTHFIGVQTDITERSIAAERLRVSEELYRSVALSISDGLMVVTSGSYVVAVNPAACRILDATMEELVMAPGLELLTESLQPLPPAEHPVARALASGEPVTERVYGLRRRDGQIRWLGVSAQPLRMAPHDKPLSAVVTFRDITQQRIAEQALSMSEQRWKFAIEGSGDGVWDWDAVADRVYYSRRWKELLGYQEHELTDSPEEWSSRVHPEDLPRVLEKLELHLKDVVPVYHSEHRLRHRSGRWLWVFERGRVVQRNEQGRALRIVGTYSDITRLKEAEKALRDKQAAELASRSKTEFLSRMSHEMRTPLNAMIGFSQLLKLSATNAQPSASQVHHYADHMLQAGQHLLALINDVLDLQRVETGQLTINIETISLRRTIEQALELLAPLAHASAVSFDNRIDEDVLVRADAQRLRQVLINIISNAIKYNRPDGVVRLTLGDRQGDAIDVLIEDTGEGLRPDQLARLFQPFERLGRETSPIEGTGLGLIIAKRLIDEMKGSIEVSSEPGKGTCVTLMVRLAEQAPAALPHEASAAPAPDPEVDLAPLRMLYVEDNPINALLFEEAMKLSGHIDLMIAEDGPQAFEIVRDWRPDILVLDAHLPGMSGFEVLRELREVHGLRDVPAFMCSADAMPEDIQRALDAGFLGYWTKPIEVRKVIAEVNQVAPRPVRVS